VVQSNTRARSQSKRDPTTLKPWRKGPLLRGFGAASEDEDDDENDDENDWRFSEFVAGFMRRCYTRALNSCTRNLAHPHICEGIKMVFVKATVML